MTSTVQRLLNDVSITPSSLQPSALSFLDSEVALAIAKAVPVQPSSAPPGALFSAIYAFGDSLTDAGNVSLATLGTVPVSPPYDHVFSNGPVWVQDLAQTLGLPAVGPSLSGGTDFAYGGADTGATPNHTVNPTDLPSQISQFTDQVASPQPNALYALWIGSNDVLDITNNVTSPTQQQTDVTDAVANEVTVIQSLAARGAQDFVVLNVPDLGKTPQEQAHAATATALSTLYDTDLATAIQGLTASGALKIDLVDTFSLINQAIANPAAYGFTNVTDPAWTGTLTSASSGTLSSNAASYLFFDRLHPTAQAHALVAADVGQTLSAV
jgi:phospholipase/lecithinase/hemolysin